MFCDARKERAALVRDGARNFVTLFSSGTAAKRYRRVDLGPEHLHQHVLVAHVPAMIRRFGDLRAYEASGLWHTE